MRILTILVRYGTRQYVNAAESIDEIFARQMRAVEHHTLVVDNSLPAYVVERISAVKTLIGGDNSFFEFSGWDKGIEFVGHDLWSYDLVHLATSAFDRLYVRFVERFDIRLLRNIVGRPVCVGHIDCYNESVRFLYVQSQHWLRTSFFFAPPAELKMLTSLVSFPHADRLFSGDPVRPFRSDAPISKNFQNYILNWLTGEDIGQGVHWHSAFRLDQETLPYFEQKAMAIINEHILSARLRAAACQVIDVTWLATQLATREDGEISWHTTWRDQLAQRDNDAVVIAGSPEVITSSCQGGEQGASA